MCFLNITSHICLHFKYYQLKTQVKPGWKWFQLAFSLEPTTTAVIQMQTEELKYKISKISIIFWLWQISSTLITEEGYFLTFDSVMFLRNFFLRSRMFSLNKIKCYIELTVLPCRRQATLGWRRGAPPCKIRAELGCHSLTSQIGLAPGNTWLGVAAKFPWQHPL